MIFIASASLNPTSSRQNGSREDAYLPSMIPASTNVLQPLATDPAFAQKDPFLPASRLLRVVPAKYSEDPIYNVLQESGHPTRIVPAASARIRYSRLNSFCGRPKTIANLDFEVTPFVNSEVIFDRADLRLSDGSIEMLTEGSGLVPPVSCYPRDDITFIYKLTPEYGPDSRDSTTAAVSVLDISLEAVINVSKDCNPRIMMQWTTNIDFSMALNPHFGAPSQALQRINRPTSLSTLPSQAGSGAGGTPTNRTSLRERAYSATDMGVTMSFSGPPSVVVGKPFSWGVFIVNRSSAPRKFAMVAIPRRKVANARGHVARPSSSSMSNRRSDQVAEAVTDDNIVHAMQKSVAGQEADLVSLSTDVRVG